MTILETLINENHIFFQILFNPFLWITPCFLTGSASLYQVVRHGIHAKFGLMAFKVGGRERRQSSINVFFFSALWIFSIFIFPKIGLNEMTTVYLAFATIFSTYGIGELMSRLLWIKENISENGFVPVLKGLMYPIYFASNNVPLYMFLKGFEISSVAFNLFLILQAVHFCMWILHAYLCFIVRKKKHVISENTALINYYLTRFVAVLAYSILLFGLLRC